MGPYDFGALPAASTVAASSNFPALCPNNPVSTLFVNNPVSSSVYDWSTPNGSITTNPSSGTSIDINGPGTYYVAQRLFSGCDVYAIDTIQVVYTSGSCSILPGSKIEINGTAKGTKAIISWKVEEELLSATNKFVVERSANNGTYVKVAEVNADAAKVVYSIDDILTTGLSTYNYRIRLLKKDNTGAYSSSVQVKVKLEGDQVSFYPNPVQNELNFYMATTARNAQLAIYDIAGIIVQQTTFSGNNVRLNISSLKPGSYYLKVQQKDKSEVKLHKFVKL